MVSYEIEWKHSAERELRRIDKQYIPKILEAVGVLIYCARTNKFVHATQPIVNFMV